MEGGGVMHAIVYQNVEMSYTKQKLIENFNLAIDEGEFVTIIGTSGCGKTTILKMVNGLVKPHKGTIYVHGKDIETVNKIDLRRNIGYAIQGNVLFPHMTVEQNIAYVPNLLNKKHKTKTAVAVEKWMKIVGLDEDLRSRYPDQLSGGQQQRVGIARALAASCDIVLMDEPFGAVDEITRASLQDEIKRIHAQTGITILFVTHDIDEALKLGTKVLVMDHGEILQYASSKEVVSSPANAFVESLIQRYITKSDRKL